MLKEEEKARPIVEKDQREIFFTALTRLNAQIPAAATFAMTLGVREAEMLNSRWEWLTAEAYDVRSRTKGKKHRVIATPPILHTVRERAVEAAHTRCRSGDKREWLPATGSTLLRSQNESRATTGFRGFLMSQTTLKRGSVLRFSILF